MAQRVNIVLVDDIDQSDAEETVTFGLDGKEYAIDLNAKNARKLRDALAPYVAHGRPVSSRGGRRSAAKAAAARLLPRSAPGRGRTAWTCPNAAASPPRSARPTPPPTDLTVHHHPRAGDAVRSREGGCASGGPGTLEP